MVILFVAAATLVAAVTGSGPPGSAARSPADSVRVVAAGRGAAARLLRPDSTRVYTMPEIRVTASRWVPELNRLPLATTTLDRAAIESSGALNAGEVLRPLVGVRVASLGGIGAFSPLSIRGSTNDQVLVLIDGRRLNTAQGGGADVSDLPLENIERIEVARGGASALYGPDAIGGAINLITKDPADGKSARLRAEVGSFGTRIVSGSVSETSDRVAFRLNGRLLDSQGDYVFHDGSGGAGRIENGALESRAIDGALSWRAAAGARLEIRGSHYRATKGIPGATEFPSATAVQKDERSAVDFEIPALPDGGSGFLAGGGAITRLSGFAQRQIRHYDDPGYPLGAVHDAHRNDAFGVALEQKRRLGRAGTLIAGGEYRDDRLTSSTDGRHSRPASAAWARQIVSGSGAAWSVIPAVRLDQVRGFAASWSPRVLGSFRATPALEVRGSFGRSFRPPSFDDLFLPARASAAGNPGLRPERSVDGDAGVTVTRKQWSAGLTAFRSQVRDLIQWQPGAGGVWRPHNVDGATLSGIEVETEARFAIPAVTPAASVQLNYTFLDPRDAGHDPNTGGRDLVYRPRHRLNGDIRLSRGPWSIESQWRYTGPVFTTRANTKRLPGYLVGDAGLAWKATPSLTVELRSLNVTGTTYEDIRDYPVPGRQWRLAAAWKSGG